MMNDERMLFWELVKSLKKPEYLQKNAFVQQEHYQVKDIKLVITDAGFTSKIIAKCIVAIDNGTNFEIRKGNVNELKGLMGEISA